MKILMVNKFLHPNGGSETYIFKLGHALQTRGHEVQYFGMEHVGRCVGNRVDAYTRDMDFHGGSKLSKITYPLKTIYSFEARRKLRQVLDDFQPSVVHLNNFNFQLTPSIILEARAWSHHNNKPIKIVFTAHDYQFICPNHMMRCQRLNENCEKCVNGSFINCVQNSCIHGSLLKSLIGTLEGYYWKHRKTYSEIDTVVCPSQFIQSKMQKSRFFHGKTVTLHNFLDHVDADDIQKGDYVLYFGRFSKEKGFEALIEVCRKLPDIKFVFAGSGPLEGMLNGITNAENVGFQTGDALRKTIAGARFSVMPSEWYENCPFTVMESQLHGTPVLGADIGGIPELIRPGVTGDLFESGNSEALRAAILSLWRDNARAARYAENCRSVHFDTAEEYCEKILPIYGSES